MHSFFHVSNVSWKTVYLIFSCALVGLVGGVGGGVLYENNRVEEQPIPIQQLPVILDDQHQDTRSENQFNFLKRVEEGVFDIWFVPKQTKKAQDPLSVQIQFRGYANVLTSDGWLVTSSVLDHAQGDIKIIDRDKKEYVLEKQLDDETLGVSFIKIPTSGLRPFQFPAWLDTSSSIQGYLFDNHMSVTPLVLSRLGYPTIQTFQQALQSTLFLEKVANPDTKYFNDGTPVVNNKGELVGVASHKKGIIPVGYIKDALSSLLKYGALKRPQSNIQYVDISAFPYLPATLKYPKDTLGAYVVAPDKKDVSTTFIPGDIIVSLNNDTIDRNRSLSELVQQYHQGDTVSFKFIRNGKELVKEVVLP